MSVASLHYLVCWQRMYWVTLYLGQPFVSLPVCVLSDVPCLHTLRGGWNNEIFKLGYLQCRHKRDSAVLLWQSLGKRPQEMSLNVWQVLNKWPQIMSRNAPLSRLKHTCEGIGHWGLRENHEILTNRQSTHVHLHICIITICYHQIDVHDYLSFQCVKNL